MPCKTACLHIGFRVRYATGALLALSIYNSDR